MRDEKVGPRRAVSSCSLKISRWYFPSILFHSSYSVSRLRHRDTTCAGLFRLGPRVIGFETRGETKPSDIVIAPVVVARSRDFAQRIERYRRRR